MKRFLISLEARDIRKNKNMDNISRLARYFFNKSLPPKKEVSFELRLSKSAFVGAVVKPTTCNQGVVGLNPDSGMTFFSSSLLFRLGGEAGSN